MEGYMRIKIKAGQVSLVAELNDSKTAHLIWETLPIEGSVSLWGEEIYFPIPVTAELEEGYAKDVVRIGDIGYWPQGACFCIFFGKTPISTESEIRPASSVNVVGRTLEDATVLKSVRNGEKILIEKIQE
jgi:hypothetical protein